MITKGSICMVSIKLLGAIDDPSFDMLLFKLLLCRRGSLRTTGTSSLAIWCIRGNHRIYVEAKSTLLLGIGVNMMRRRLASSVGRSYVKV